MPFRVHTTTEYCLTCDQHPHIEGPRAVTDGAEVGLAVAAGWTVDFSLQTCRWTILCPELPHE